MFDAYLGDEIGPDVGDRDGPVECAQFVESLDDKWSIKKAMTWTVTWNGPGVGAKGVENFG